MSWQSFRYVDEALKLLLLSINLLAFTNAFLWLATLLAVYLNNRVFLLRNYRLIVAPRKFDVLKTNIYPRSEAEKRSFEGKYASFKNITFLRGNYQTDSSETYTLLSLCFTTKFSSARQFKNHVELFSTFLDESRESQCKISKRKQTKTLLIQFRLFIFYKTACLQKYFHGRVLSIRVFSLDGHYLNNRVFLSRNYRLIVAPRKFDVLKTNICPRSEASRANMLVLRTSNFQGATIRLIVPRHKHSIVFIVHH